MITTIDIRTGDFDTHVDLALQWIRSGLIIVAPLENGYAFLADAFDHDAVRAMHVLRNDPLGVVAQVLISSHEVIDGIAREVSESARLLMSTFWPGQLSFNLLPQRGLTWDLGDEKRLDLVSVRVPSADFVLALLRKSGPLAVGSATSVGRPPILDIKDISVREYDLAGIFDSGVLASTSASTVISLSQSGVEVIRDGAVSNDQLREIAPDIVVSSSANTKPRE